MFKKIFRLFGFVKRKEKNLDEFDIKFGFMLKHNIVNKQNYNQVKHH